MVNLHWSVQVLPALKLISPHPADFATIRPPKSLGRVRSLCVSISVVIPIYNERDNVELCHRQLTTVL